MPPFMEWDQKEISPWAPTVIIFSPVCFSGACSSLSPNIVSLTIFSWKDVQRVNPSSLASGLFQPISPRNASILSN